MEVPSVRYVKTIDGFEIAYWVLGRGHPFVYMPGQFSDLHAFWNESHMMGPWTHALASRYQLLQYDGRGQGMSSRGIGSAQSVASLNHDLEAVVEAEGLTRFVLQARWFACHQAILYALANPEKLSALILVACAGNNDAWPSSLYLDLPEQDWDVFLWSQVPREGRTLEQTRRRVEGINKLSTRADLATRTKAQMASRVTQLLAKVHVPTLVLHPRNYILLPASESMNVAAKIPGARFAFIDGEMLPGDAVSGIKAIDAFLGELGLPLQSGQSEEPDTTVVLTQRETEVLRLIAGGYSNQQVANSLVLSLRTVEHHITSLYAKIGARGKADATAYAMRHGML